MSYKLKWLEILTTLNSNLKSLTSNTYLKSEKIIEFKKTIVTFKSFVEGNYPLLAEEEYNLKIISLFDETIPNLASLTDMQIEEKIKTLIALIELTIPKIKESSSMSINIDNITGGSHQFGNNNIQNITDINIDLQTLIQEIANSNDQEAKSKLRELLENGTVASIIGATTSTIFEIIQKLGS